MAIFMGIVAIDTIAKWIIAWANENDKKEIIKENIKASLLRSFKRKKE